MSQVVFFILSVLLIIDITGYISLPSSLGGIPFIPRYLGARGELDILSGLHRLHGGQKKAEGSIVFQFIK